MITSSIRKNPKIIPNTGIKYATWVWNTNPLTVNILNLINQAKPVATTPRYNNDNVDSNDGLAFQGASNIIDRGNKKITDQRVVEVVTFSLTLFLSLRVNKPPIQ